jgi:tetratricopeptide (TPR) repeat protein
MDNLDYIDRYFKSELPPEGVKLFGEKIESDPAFAEEVAFYLSASQASREQVEAGKKQRFLEIYRKNLSSGNTKTVRKLVYYLAAAAVVAGIVFGLYFFTKPVSRQQLADQYIRGHLQTLGVQMSSRNDSLQTGLRLYNEGRPAKALQQFEKIIQSDTSNFTAKKYAGIVSLRLKEYDKALAYFEQLETYTGLYANPALLYQALTLMERNHAGDDTKAKQLLQQVIQKDLEGKEAAQEWLKKW